MKSQLVHMWTVVRRCSTSTCVHTFAPAKHLHLNVMSPNYPRPAPAVQVLVSLMPRLWPSRRHDATEPKVTKEQVEAALPALWL